MESVAVLFSKKLPLIIKSPDRDKRKAYIQICVEVQSTVSPLAKKEMVIRLTDEQDLFFLHTLHLGEDDFQSLKMQQGLLVDFGAFPQSVIDLLHSALAEEHKDMPKFILELVNTGAGGLGSSSSTLNVVETNSFKHLTHLALKFLPGSDSDIKKYLADCLKTLKDQNQRLYNKLQHTESELSGQLRQAREALAARTTELDSLKSEWKSRENDLSAKHVQDVNEEKEKALQIQASWQNKYEREKRELEQSNAKILKQLEAKMYDLETSNRDLTDIKYKSDGIIREMKSKLSITEEELHRAKAELSNLRKNNAVLDGDYHEQDKVIVQLKTKLAVLEQEVKDKDSLLNKTTDMLQSEQGQKKKCEEEIDKKQRHIRKLEVSVKKLSEELTKGNEIIHRLQNDVKSYHEKLKLRSKVSTEQEKLLAEKGREMEEIRKSLAETQSSLRMKENENEKLTETLNTTNQKLEESKQLLKTNENVINWLNKQVTETQLHSHRSARPFEMNSTTSSTHPAFRPAMHNYSGQSFGVAGRLSASSGAVPTASGPVSSVPQYYQPKPQQQVQYIPSQSKKTGIPIPIAKSSPVGTIPEEATRSSSPHHASPTHFSTQSRVAQQSQVNHIDPVLDEKYFQKTGSFDDTPHLPRTRRTSPTPIHFSSSPNGQTINSTRLNKDSIVPNIMAAKPTQGRVPLSSAYFPSNPTKVT